MLAWFKLKKIVGSHSFSTQFIKLISHYKKIGYNINVLQHTLCLVVNTIMFGNFDFLFNCTLVCRTLDSMTIPTWRLICWWNDGGQVLWLLSGCGVCLLYFFCSGTLFCVLLRPYLCFISFLCFGLYVLWDYALLSLVFFMQPRHLCVLILIWTKGWVGTPWNRFKPSSELFYWCFRGSASFVDNLCY